MATDWAEVGKKQTARNRAVARANTKLKNAHPEEWHDLYEVCYEEVLKELDGAAEKV